MAKNKGKVFFCTECGCEESKWSGQCPSCGAWNTMQEAPSTNVSMSKTSFRALGGENRPVSINEIAISHEERRSTGFGELDRVLGGGLVDSSLILVGGDPGIGKSTILLQVCKNMSENGADILYISGEESLKQIKLRAQRIGEFPDNMKLFCETDLGIIESIIAKEKPTVVVIDSIQTIYREGIDSAPGSITQVREATHSLMKIAKGMQVTVFIVGHVTKEGTVAGPKVLEHMVDTVLYFEGDRNAIYRIIRGVKNRFGSTNEIGVFEMQGNGLREVLNPSEYMISGRPENASGCVVSCYMEGTRPMLVEVQALVCQSNFGMARRTSAGTDYNRINLLMAVLEKKVGIQLSGCDAYINVAGGIKVNDPSIDMALIAAIVSSFKNKELSSKALIFGEVGLAGEVRAVSQPQLRINEAVKLGFEVCIIPELNLKNIKDVEGIKIIGVSTINDLVSVMFAL